MIDSDMKKITNLLYMLAVLLLASCSDFLDMSPKNTADPETTVTDDVAIALTNACYRTLQSSNMYNQRIWTLDIVAGNSLVGAGDSEGSMNAANILKPALSRGEIQVIGETTFDEYRKLIE